MWGGGFISYLGQPSIGGQPRNYLAGIDASTGLATPSKSNPSGNVSALAVSGGIVYVGGDFTTLEAS